MCDEKTAEKRRMTIYLDADTVEFLRHYAWEFEITTINKAVIDVLHGAADTWREQQR